MCCINRQNRESGRVPSEEDLIFLLRRNREQIDGILTDLLKAGLIKKDKYGYYSDAFKKRNFAKDSSTDRVIKYREKREELGLPKVAKYDVSQIIKRDGGKCVYCGSTESLCVDHLIPISLNGKDDYDNLACACKKCNSGKAGRTPEQAGYEFLDKNAEKRYLRYVSCNGFMTHTESEGEQSQSQNRTEGDKKNNNVAPTSADIKSDISSIANKGKNDKKDKSFIIDLLKKIGIPGSTAYEYTKRYPCEYLVRKIFLLEYYKNNTADVRNDIAFIRSAIEFDNGKFPEHDEFFQWFKIRKEEIMENKETPHQLKQIIGRS